jgi:hypothetical protein
MHGAGAQRVIIDYVRGTVHAFGLPAGSWIGYGRSVIERITVTPGESLGITIDVPILIAPGGERKALVPAYQLDFLSGTRCPN